MPSPFGIWRGPDFKELAFTTPPFLIDQWLRDTDTLMLIGKEGIGKSTLLFQLMAALTTGKPFLGEFAVLEPRACVYVQLEGDKHETYKRLTAIEHSIGFAWERFTLIFQPFQNLQADAGFDAFQQLIDHAGSKSCVLFIDPFYALFGGSGNDDAVIKPVLNHLRIIRESWEASLVICHHIRKAIFNPKTGSFLEEGAEDALGSRLISGWFDSTMLLTEGEGHLRHIRSSKGRKGGYFDVLRCKGQEVIVDEEDSPVILFKPMLEVAPDCHKLLMWLAIQTHPCGLQQMAEVSGVTIITIQRWLKAPYVAACVKRVNPGHRPVFYAHLQAPAASFLTPPTA